MSRQYLFIDNFVGGPGHANWEAILARARASKVRPTCLCMGMQASRADEGKRPQMYVALINGRHVLKRMPSSGATHSTACEHYEAPEELSGRGQVEGAAICENPEDGTTTLRLDFALTRGSGRPRQPTDQLEHDGVKSETTRLTLRATLHYLWDEAALTRWSPRMHGKRTWSVVRREILSAAASKRTKGMPLCDALYVPEPFQSRDVAGMKERRAHSLRRLFESPASRMLLVAEVKSLDAARFGHRLMLEHMPDLPIQVTDDLHKRIATRYLAQFTMWGRLEDTTLVVVGTIAQPLRGVLALEEASFVNVNSAWMPFESLAEYEVLKAMEERRFVKGLRYNLPHHKPSALAILQDTECPVAMYILDETGAPEHRAALLTLAESSNLTSWIWPYPSKTMPALPPAIRSFKSAA